jgi:CRP-like cAMP-binding protein
VLYRDVTQIYSNTHQRCEKWSLIFHFLHFLMDALLESLITLTKLQKKAIEPVLALFTHKAVPAKHKLLAANEHCATVWFVGKGLLRAYYYPEERRRKNSQKDITTREVTNWIVPSGGFLTDISSFLHQKLSSYYIETLHDSDIYTLTYDSYLVIQKTHPEIAKAIFEHTLVMADLRVKMMNLRSPMERLEMFERLYPTLRGQISVNIQASYLNIEPATLSRLRSQF